MTYPIHGTNEVETSKNNSQNIRESQGSEADSTSSSLNPPVIPTFRDIGNFLGGVAMFYFFKGLAMLRIVAGPCAGGAICEEAHNLLLNFLFFNWVKKSQKGYMDATFFRDFLLISCGYDTNSV